jgi:hypothetical protein
VDAETKDLLRSSVRELFDSQGGDIAAGLEEFGWDDVVAEDPAAAVDLLFSEQGAAGRSSSALDSVAFLGQANGAVNGRLIIHPIAGLSAATRVGEHLLVDGVILGLPDRAALVGLDDAGYEISGDVVQSAASPVSGFDPSSRLHRVRTTIPADTATRVEIDWSAVTAVICRALASELVGNGRAMLHIAAEQITGRMQFGRPIGANQTPRHRLAECYALLSGADELAQAAWRSATPWDARVAKTYAGYAAHATSRACMQVCGAIGLTTEHRLPTYVKRGRILDGLYGGWEQWVHELGARLLDTAAIPAAARI